MSRCKLTAKQERFVEEYVVDFNATQAAIRAGYSRKSADRIGPQQLLKTCVAEAIAKRRDALSESAVVSVERVREMMLEMYEVSSQRVPVKTFEGEQVRDGDGNPVFKLLDAGACAKAIDMLAKHTGAYEADNRKELLGSVNFVWGARGDGEGE